MDQPPFAPVPIPDAENLARVATNYTPLVATDRRGQVAVGYVEDRKVSMLVKGKWSVSQPLPPRTGTSFISPKQMAFDAVGQLWVIFEDNFGRRLARWDGLDWREESQLYSNDTPAALQGIRESRGAKWQITQEGLAVKKGDQITIYPIGGVQYIAFDGQDRLVISSRYELVVCPPGVGPNKLRREAE